MRNNTVFPSDRMEALRDEAESDENGQKLPFKKCFLIVAILQFVLSFCFLVIGSVCTALGTSPQTPEVVTPAPPATNDIYPNCFWGSAIWIGVVCLISSIVGFIAILRLQYAVVMYGYFISAMLAALFSLVLFGVMVHWLDLWAGYHEAYPSWSLAKVNIALNVLLLISSVGNTALNISSFCMLGWYLGIVSMIRNRYFTIPEPVPKDDFHQNTLSYDLSYSNQVAAPYSEVFQPQNTSDDEQNDFAGFDDDEDDDQNHEIPQEPTPDTPHTASYAVRGSDHKAYFAKPVYVIPTSESQRSVASSDDKMADDTRSDITIPPPIPEATYPDYLEPGQNKNLSQPSDVGETSSEADSEGTYDSVPEDLIQSYRSKAP